MRNREGVGQAGGGSCRLPRRWTMGRNGRKEGGGRQWRRECRWLGRDVAESKTLCPACNHCIPACWQARHFSLVERRIVLDIYVPQHRRPRPKPRFFPFCHTNMMENPSLIFASSLSRPSAIPLDSSRLDSPARDAKLLWSTFSNLDGLHAKQVAFGHGS